MTLFETIKNGLARLHPLLHFDRREWCESECGPFTYPLLEELAILTFQSGGLFGNPQLIPASSLDLFNKPIVDCDVLGICESHVCDFVRKTKLRGEVRSERRRISGLLLRSLAR